MYKVFINNKSVLLTNFFNKILPEQNKKVISYKGIEPLIAEIESIESGETIEDLFVIQNHDLDKLVKDFFSLYKIIVAGGGVVKNEKDEILFIFRLGKWDLPKGKGEPEEAIEETALREVKEETGLRDVKIIKELTPSYHTYHQGGERVIKKTSWFEMFASGKQALVPQTKEDITMARWFHMNNLDEPLMNTYQSIKDTINSCLK